MEGLATKLANSTYYGLIAAIWTRDAAFHRLARCLHVGQSSSTASAPPAASSLRSVVQAIEKGFGHEKGFLALLGFTRSNTVVVKLDD